MVWGHIAAISQEKAFQLYIWIWAQELQEDGVAGGVDVHFQVRSLTFGQFLCISQGKGNTSTEKQTPQAGEHVAFACSHGE